MKINSILPTSCGLIIIFCHSFSAAVNAQDKTAPCQADSLSILRGRAQILIKQGDYEKISQRTIKSKFSDLCSDKLLDSDGIEISNTSALYFFQTNIEFPKNEDYGLAIWKLIEPITTRIPMGIWVESGWRYMNSNNGLYFVKIRAGEKKYHLVFFELDEKLAFSLLELKKYDEVLDPSITLIGNNLRLTKRDSHMARYVAKG